MSINKIKKLNLLQVFDLVTTHGKKSEGSYELSGIRASHDFDGYTCWLAYKDLTVTLLFHGAVDFDYQEPESLDIFFKKISNLLDKKSEL